MWKDLSPDGTSVGRNYPKDIDVRAVLGLNGQWSFKSCLDHNDPAVWTREMPGVHLAS